eukprot:8925749-Pyramimonas_sp.AAC.1
MRVHISGGYAHSSHVLRFHSGLGIWFCTACGCFASEQLRQLGAVCHDAVNGNRRDYLDRITRGLWPKVRSKAELARKKQQGI